MLRELTFEQLQEWMAYDKISPVGDRRSDWQAASVCAAVVNSAAARSGSNQRVRVSDMLLEFTDDEKAAPAAPAARPGKSEAEMKFIARMCASMANAEEDRKTKKKRR